MEIPVGVADVTVSQISGEDQNPARGSLAAGLPALQHPAGMGVSLMPSSA